MDTMGSDFFFIFDSFLKLRTFRENYPAKLGFLGSIEVPGWVNRFYISGYAQSFIHKNYDSRKCQLSDLLTFFLDFLDIYTAKSNIIDLIDRTGCWKLTFVFCYTQFVLWSL